MRISVDAVFWASVDIRLKDTGGLQPLGAFFLFPVLVIRHEDTIHNQLWERSTPDKLPQSNLLAPTQLPTPTHHHPQFTSPGSVCLHAGSLMFSQAAIFRDCCSSSFSFCLAVWSFYCLKMAGCSHIGFSSPLKRILGDNRPRVKIYLP